MEFEEDGDFNNTATGKYKGVIMHFHNGSSPHYEYSPFNCDMITFNKWRGEMILKNKEREWMENIYWKLDEVSCVLVERNKKWFLRNIGSIREVWSIIEHERVNGYQHRAPVKRQPKSFNGNVVATKNGCLFKHDESVVVTKVGNESEYTSNM